MVAKLRDKWMVRGPSPSTRLACIKTTDTGRTPTSAWRV